MLESSNKLNLGRRSDNPIQSADCSNFHCLEQQHTSGSLTFMPKNASNNSQASQDNVDVSSHSRNQSQLESRQSLDQNGEKLGQYVAS